MSNQRMDEGVLIDWLRGELSEQQADEVRTRLDRDEAFRRLHDDIRHTFAAMDLLGELEPPETLTSDTMARIRQARRTEALLAREQSRRRSFAPTFSLRELGAVAAVLVLMAAVFVPSIRQGRQMAQIGQCASNTGQIGSALLAYANSNDGYLPTVDAPRGELHWVPVGANDGFSNSSALYKLIADGHASPLVFQCPAGDQGTFVVQAGMTDFPAGRFVGYSYQHSAGAGGIRYDDPQRLSVADSLAVLADCTPLFENGRFDPTQVRAKASSNHNGTGQNVLYLDMHVNWAPDAEAGVRGNNIYLADGVYSYRGDEAPAGPTDSFLLPSFAAQRAAAN